MKTIKNQKLKWKMEEYPYPLNKARSANFGIVEDNSSRTPVCKLPCSISEVQTDGLLMKQRHYANLIASAPELLDALQQTCELMGKLTDANLRMHYKKLLLQYDENIKIIDKALGVNPNLERVYD